MPQHLFKEKTHDEAKDKEGAEYYKKEKSPAGVLHLFLGQFNYVGVF